MKNVPDINSLKSVIDLCHKKVHITDRDMKTETGVDGSS